MRTAARDFNELKVHPRARLALMTLSSFREHPETVDGWRVILANAWSAKAEPKPLVIPRDEYRFCSICGKNVEEVPKGDCGRCPDCCSKHCNPVEKL
jgi:NADH pyrophosphatase NudC (nudix superfamily)